MTSSELDKRIETVHDTVKRTRSALFLCILASGAMFLCLWNTYASWDRDFVFPDDKDFAVYDSKAEQERLARLRVDFDNIKPEEKRERLVRLNAERERTAEAWTNHLKALPPHLLEQQIRSWIDTQVVSVSLLGIRISVSDFAFLGSIALAICSLYFLLCTRRENHEIGYLFQDIEDQLGTLGYHAYAMVSSFMVFNLSGSHSSGGTDAVISSLQRSVGKRIRFVRLTSSILYFLPAITLFSTIICDFGWAFTNSGHLFFFSPFRLHETRSPFSNFGAGELAYFCCAEGFALIMAVSLCRSSVLIRSYERGTRGVLEDVYKKLLAGKIARPRWKQPRFKDDDRRAAATIP